MVKVIDVEGGEDKWLFNNWFSVMKNVDTTAKPGVLIRSTTSGKNAHIKSVLISNSSASSMTIDFYDEDSTHYARFLIDAGKSLDTSIDPSIKYGSKSIYARTDTGNVDITVSGVEF